MFVCTIEESVRHQLRDILYVLFQSAVDDKLENDVPDKNFNSLVTMPGTESARESRHEESILWDVYCKMFNILKKQAKKSFRGIISDKSKLNASFLFKEDEKECSGSYVQLSTGLWKGCKPRTINCMTSWMVLNKVEKFAKLQASI